jgi:hypothetical protein
LSYRGTNAQNPLMQGTVGSQHLLVASHFSSTFEQRGMG